MSKWLIMLIAVSILPGPLMAMTPATDAELMVVFGEGSNEECKQYGGGSCQTSPNPVCIQDVYYLDGMPIPIGCKNPGHSCVDNIIWGPSNNDVCEENHPGKSCTLHTDGWCQQVQFGTCEGTVFCTCDNPGPAQNIGSRAYCM